jgi:inorganic pyrophosphatase
VSLLTEPVAMPGIAPERLEHARTFMTAFALNDIEPRGADKRQIAVVVDTPRDSRNKYKYDEKLGLFRLSRILPSGMSFPYDFGSVPRTRAADGDALDVLILTEAPTFVGCLLTVRLLGVLRATQKEKGKSIRNDRLIAVPETPVNHPAVRDLRQLDHNRVGEIEQFFVSYNRAQGREFSPGQRLGQKEAYRLIDAAIRDYQKHEGD